LIARGVVAQMRTTPRNAAGTDISISSQNASSTRIV
jgi:hypothetical protein